MIAQHLAYETVRRLVEQPETIIGCMVAYHDSNRIETIPLHALSPKPFDWELFTRMHGTELTVEPS
jgi:6-phosphofructokinase 1